MLEIYKNKLGKIITFVFTHPRERLYSCAQGGDYRSLNTNTTAELPVLGTEIFECHSPARTRARVNSMPMLPLLLDICYTWSFT